MKLRENINRIIFKYFNESNAYPFNLNIKQHTDNGYIYKIFYYDFIIDNIEYQCVIYPNLWRLRSKDFDVTFITKGGTTKDIVGRDLDFMNSVLKTVAECMIDFINKNDVVKALRFQAEDIRERAYIRFFQRHEYFSKFDMDSSYKKSGFIEININKGTD